MSSRPRVPDATLELGSVTESVQVTAPAELVDATTSQTGALIEGRRVIDTSHSVSQGAAAPRTSRISWRLVWRATTALQPFPQVPYWNHIYAYNSPLGFGTWNALEITVTRRASIGLTWMADYTLSKTISNMDSDFNTYSNHGRPQDYNNLKLDKSISPYDQTHSAKFGLRYELPLGKGLLRSGWTLQLLGRYASAFPLSLVGTPPPNANFAGYRADIVNPNGQSPLRWIPGRRLRHLDPLFARPQPVRQPHAGARSGALHPRQCVLPDIADLRLRFWQRRPGRAEGVFAFASACARNCADFRNVNRHRFSGIDTNAASPLFGQVTGLDATVYRQTQLGFRVDF